MPFLSGKQNAWGHSPSGVKALGGPSRVKEWEGATDYSKLPERVEKNTMGMKKPPKIK